LVSTLSKAAEVDPEGAAVLIDEAVSNWMLDELDAHAEVLQPAIAKTLEREVRFGKRAIGRAYVEQVVAGEYPDLGQMARWAAGLEAYVDHVSKEWTVRRGRDGKQHRVYVRRDRGGRFSATIDVGVGARKDPTGYRTVNQVSPALRNRMVVDNGQPRWADGDDEKVRGRMAAHQSQWEQAQELARQMAGEWTGNMDGVNMVFTVAPEGGGQAREVAVPLKSAKRGNLDLGDEFNPLEENILTARLDSEIPEQAKAIAEFNALGYVGRIGSTSGSWQTAFGMRDAQETGLGRLWSRLGAGAEVLRAVPGGDKAAQWASFVGSHGPDAEKVLGPYVRQAAYRYRGTEKTPDQEILAAFDSPVMGEVRAMADAEVTGRDMARAMNVDLSNPKDIDPEVGAALYRASRGSTGDQLKMQVNADVLVNELVKTLPDDRLTAELSQRSGHVLPSQGVIVDAEGQVVSQAVGYADDHYLPFDLKNVARLRGGQYVRTRVSGGLTGEDIYASVQTGARMATVVSGSGVYTVEFDPAFRGARGNSDKARSMYTRYLKILDAVNGSGMYIQDLPGPQLAQLRQQAKAMGMDAERTNEYLELNRRAAAVIPLKDGEGVDVSVEGLWEKARHMAETDPQFKSMSRPQQERRVADIFAEEVDREESKTVKPLKLNGEGYHAALSTLQQQFPYFIRSVSYEPLRSSGDQRGFFEARKLGATQGAKQTGRVDSGYVKPGGLRPASTRTGFWDPDSGEADMPKQTSQSSAPERGGVPGQSAAGGGAGAGEGSAPPAAAAAPQQGVSSSLGAKLAAGAGSREASRKKAVTDLAESIDALPVPPAPHAKQDIPTWEQAKAEIADPMGQLQWALVAPATRITEQLSTPEGLALWSDPGRVKSAFLKTYPQGELEEFAFGDEGGMHESMFGGAKDLPAAMDWVTQQARVIGDSSALVEPFGGAATGDMAQDAGWRGSKPLLFSDMDTIDSADKLNAYLNTTPGRELSGLLDELGVDEKGGYRSTDDAVKQVKSRLDVLDRVAAFNASEMGRVAGGPMTDDILKPIPPAKVASAVGVTPEELERTLGSSFTDFKTDVTEAKLQQRQMQLQRAWSLATVERLLAQMEGGDAVPKERILRREPQGVAKGSSSRQVTVVSRDHRLAKQVALRKSLGLPLVKSRVI
jgi:hypothetical protein